MFVTDTPFVVLDADDEAEAEDYDLFDDEPREGTAREDDPEPLADIEDRAQELLAHESEKTKRAAEAGEALSKVIPREFHSHFRLGGWYNRLKTSDPSTLKPPNRGSARPKDIDPTTWAGCGQGPQEREKKCRKEEQEGKGPPEIPKEILDGLASQW